MAFNFNWSPLIADSDRVRDLLTHALNKSPKPPIIVGDIVVNQLNLGSTPPQLEILEIGDLAEDRFKGIFKMTYTGDAYLTLKTRVQANPLNTFLGARPGFASPQPLAAATGLTIPLQITLSDIRLSGFVMLVFSKQKGITLLFRNDPLDALKVSSTFDAIPFVRDYLQQTIESQLRVLFVEDLPAIIHRLSLRVFPDGPDIVDAPVTQPEHDKEAPVLADSENFASFSQKNLLRLAALSESQRTLSLFTPGMRDTVYRAWASVADPDRGPAPVYRPTLSRISTGIASGPLSTRSYTSEASAASATSLTSRHSVASLPITMASGARARPRKRKNRVVDLRSGGRSLQTDTADSVSGAENPSDCCSSLINSEPAAISGNSRAHTLCSDTLPPQTPPRTPGDGIALNPLTGSPAWAARTQTPRTLRDLSSPEKEKTPRPSRQYLSPPSTGLKIAVTDKTSRGVGLGEAWLAKREEQEHDNNEIWTEPPPAYAL